MPHLDNETDRLAFIAPSGGVTAGNLYLIGALLVLALADAAAGASFPGAFDDHIVRGAPKKSTDVIAVGDALYWDATNKYLTTTATGNKLVTIAVSAQVNGDTTVDIHLDSHIAAAFTASA